MDLIRCGISVVAAAALSVLVGCASSSEGGGGGRDPAGTAGGGTAGVGMEVGTGDEFGPAARSRMNTAWDAFVKNSPEWPRLRAEWVGLGRRATNTLVENLFRAMVLSRLKSFPEGYERSRLELVKLGELAVPTLAGVLRNPYFSDRSAGRRAALPTGVVTDVADVLALAVPASVDPLAQLSRSGVPAVRRACMVALGKTRHPSAVPSLADRLDASDWTDRMTAARALGYTGRREAIGPLVEALGDSDPAVVKTAAGSLAQLGARSAIGALEARRERARGAGRHDVAAACGAAVRAIRSGR